MKVINHVGDEVMKVFRAYYAMFYAVLSLLAIEKKETSRRSAAMALFDQLFVKPGTISKELSSWLHEAFALRQQVDYGTEPPPERSGAGRMDAALRLLELPGVAQEDQAARGLRHKGRVRQGELPGLVDEQHVHGARHLGTAPEPGRSGREADGSVGQARANVVVAVRGGDLGSGAAVVLVRLLKGRDGEAHGASRPARLFQQVADHLVAGGGDPDPLARLKEREDHARARERLPRAGRTLDGKHRAIERCNESLGRGEHAFPGRGEIHTGNGAYARRTPEQQVSGGPERGLLGEAMQVSVNVYR